MTHPLRRLWTLNAFADSLRVCIALSAALAISLLLGRIGLVIPLFLGIIACALADTDDDWQGRLQALCVTLGCFVLASTVVQWLYPWPWLFAPGLFAFTFGMIMLGAIGQRYATTALGTLILALYAMLNREQHGDAAAAQQLLLIAGAAGYGLISVIWSALFARQPLKQSLARLYKALGKLLMLKAALFEPIRGADIDARRLAFAHRNAEVLAAFQQTKEMLFRRLEGRHHAPRINRYLRLYFIAQDIHERACSTHYPYDALIRAFFHHDVLFRCQRLLDQQGLACRRLAKSLLLNRAFDHHQSEQALTDLRASIVSLSERGRQEWQPLLPPLNALTDNLAALEARLADAHNPEALTDSQLHDRSPATLKDAWQRVQQSLTPASPTFRHAVRLAAALTAGYALVQWLDPTQGVWVLLTTLFVCRPNFAATRRFLYRRVAGTVAGLVAGWALISLFPSPGIQSLIAVAAGVAFFASRERYYLLATAAITLLVLCSFNQVGDGFDLIWPRLLDTLLGVLIAALAVRFVLPDWQRRRVYVEAAALLDSQRRYLTAIIRQYAVGKQDDLAYRLARRNAHSADTAFSTLLGDMRNEPGHKRDAEAGMRFWLLANALLSHLSALGAHREPLAEHAALVPLAEQLGERLEELGNALAARQQAPSLPPSPLIDTARFEHTDAATLRMVSQLELIAEQLPPLGDAANRRVAD
ncbi:MAG: YccS family putative transporter [Halomonadaceae bacterium]